MLAWSSSIVCCGSSRQYFTIQVFKVIKKEKKNQSIVSNSPWSLWASQVCSDFFWKVWGRHILSWSHTDRTQREVTASPLGDSFIKSFAWSKSFGSIESKLHCFISTFILLTVQINPEKKPRWFDNYFFVFWNSKDIIETMLQHTREATLHHSWLVCFIEACEWIFRSCPFKTGKRLSPDFGFGVRMFPVSFHLHNLEASLCWCQPGRRSGPGPVV